MKNVAILGSTGSIGRNTLKVIKNLKDFNVSALFGGNNISLLTEQAEEFKVEYVGSFFEKNKEELKKKLKNNFKILIGHEEADFIYENSEIDVIVIATAGISSYKALIKGLENGKRICTANKETLVAFSPILKKKLKSLPGELVPIDSEHSAIYQILSKAKRNNIEKIIITASGGPFYNRNDLSSITPKEALNHPTWEMGKKVTIDSATLMNKGLEIIEASVFFDLGCEDIEVIIHPESIIHGMVEFKDGSIISQMSIPDMKIPIQFALTNPDRENFPAKRLNLKDISSLNFKEIDQKRFPLIPLCYKALREGGTLPAVLVGADEVAVDRFLKGEISFKNITDTIVKVTKSHKINKNPGEKEIMEAINWAREEARRLM
ncbi:1-deoxy-D-xylulose-5-phosphate reductoisomerase [candidate division WOR-3 bacterium]|nr:1-deoxy-D-xylulose-5-phosphate reductoisomerase [candidate division WOR-3 bacterium]